MFKVIAINKYGMSKPSSTCYGQTIGAPKVPEIGSTGDITATTISFTWKDKEQVAADDPISYSIEMAEAKSSDFKAVNANITNNGVKGWQAVIENLESGKSYQFQLIASNKQGSSPPSKPLTIKTLDGNI